MQTFLPYPDFAKSAQVLDNRRLGKQRVECLQILKALNDSTYGWQNHPAVKMWCGYKRQLLDYGLAICKEWKQRGFNDTCASKMIMLVDNVEELTDLVGPTWLGDKSFHASHRSNLLRKDPQWYGQFGWTEPDNLPYIWPVK